MISVVATMAVRSGAEAAFESAMADLAAQVRANEPGCKLYTLVKDAETPGRYLVLELYDDEAAMRAHGESAHFRAAAPGLGGHLAGPPDIRRYPVVT